MTNVRLSGLAASTALALILALSSQPGLAQSSSDGQAQVTSPIPETVAKPKDGPVPAMAAQPSKDAAAKSDAGERQPAEGMAKDAEAPVKAEAATAKTDAKTDTKTEAKTESKPEAPQSGTAAAPSQAPTATADTAVADALKGMISGRLDRFVPRKDDRAGVEAFYKKRDYKPLWVSGGGADARAKAAIAYIASVAADGLDPNDYPTPDFAAATGASELAAAELELTKTVLSYARDAQVGRIHFTRVGSDISFKLEAPEPAAVLANMADTKDVAAALDGYNPPQAGFKALKAKLAELRQQAAAPAKPEQEKKLVRVDPGPILRPGMRDRRVVQLRKRLDIGDTDNPLYDEAVLDAVKAFQMQAGIGVDGLTGPGTVRALNSESTAKRRPQNSIDTVIVNMERWRWLPRNLGNANGEYVVVNPPDYTLSLMRGGKLYWKTKIVVGKPGKATPMVTADMKYITVNPTWNVPPSIVSEEYLPALEQDPQALERIGVKVRQEPDGTVRMWQPPGDGNALGRLRFNFPNKFLVYQHDTPDKYLFKRAKRAYSHGCMRVQYPLEYAIKLLSLEMPGERYTPERIKGMYGDNEVNINFPRPIPVHLTYQTAFVDEDGALQLREDVYGRDARMIAILKNARERRVASIPLNLPPDQHTQPVRLPAGTFAGDGGYPGRGYGGPNFFQLLFGGRAEQPSAPSYQSERHRRPVGRRAHNDGRYSQR